jgi:hypothetical protein
MNYLLCNKQPPNFDEGINLDINNIKEWENLSLEGRLLNLILIQIILSSFGKAKKVLNGMLQMKKEARFSIEDVLQSPWINVFKILNYKAIDNDLLYCLTIYNFSILFRLDFKFFI